MAEFSKKLKILLAENKHERDPNRGSYRIWIRDLAEYLKTKNVEVYLTKDKPIDFYDVCILGKKCTREDYIKERKPNQLLGLINPPSENGKIWKHINFCIVGSIEEKDSLIQFCPNIFVFPLIENIFMKVPRKIHEKKDTIVIGYHGNSFHLNHMEPNIRRAIQNIAKEHKVIFMVITGGLTKINDWKKGRPQNVETKIINWTLPNFKKFIKEIDIGIVPNISEFNIGGTNNIPQDGKYSTDIRIRFKNKSNNGRALVFHQNGIPVVADITPSNMHILANPDNGYAVLGEKGWYYAFKELMDENHRNFISENAYNEFHRLYNPYEWAGKLLKNIEVLHSKHQN
jgi:hypothetical protein